ncbi:MAG TPA: FmdB family zinc ribbon protein [Armatimonadota bacterium]|nr:FmdB family zinc ribbon protein [Armatimonadota bacterium]
MPIYEYECNKCGLRFDVMQSFNDAPVKTCEGDACKGRVRKVLSPPTIIYKGSGFYTTDNAKRSGSGSTSKPKESVGASESSGETTKTSDGKDD